MAVEKIGELLHGSESEIAEIMRARIDMHKPHAIKCLEAAYEILYTIQTTPSSPHPDTGEMGVKVDEIFTKLGADFGVEFTPEQMFILYDALMNDLNRAGGMTLCAAWTFAHALEHLTFHGTH